MEKKSNKKESAKVPVSSVHIDDHELSPAEKKVFFEEKVSRGEVASFVEGYMTHDVLPGIMSYVNSQCNHNLGLISVCQAIMVDSGMITQEKMSELFQNWEKSQIEQSEKKKSDHENNLRVIK